MPDQIIDFQSFKKQQQLQSKTGYPSLQYLEKSYSINEYWVHIFTHFILLDAHNVMPKKQWYNELSQKIKALGEAEFSSYGSQWISSCIEKSKENQRRYRELGIAASNEAIENSFKQTRETPEWVKKVYGEELISGSFFKHQAWVNNFQNYFYYSLGGRILRGFLHSNVVLQNESLKELFEQFVKLHPNDCQDAIHIYEQSGTLEAIAKLSALKTRIKNKNLLKRVDKALVEIAKLNNISTLELEEQNVPTYGFDSESTYIEEMSLWRGVIQIINSNSIDVFYLDDKNKKTKSPPKGLKDAAPEQLKAFKKLGKTVLDTLVVQRKRLESQIFQAPNLSYARWQTYYCSHPLVKHSARSLIWEITQGNLTELCIWHEDQLVTIDKQPTALQLEACTLRVWHPATSSGELQLAWQKFLVIHSKTQAFKQAFREVYRPPLDNGTPVFQDSQFCDYIVKKDQLAQLCKARKWSTPGLVDSEGVIRFRYPADEFIAEFGVHDYELGDSAKVYGSAHTKTAELRFIDKKKNPLPIDKIPLAIFSETMRDIDLFISVAGLYVNPSNNTECHPLAEKHWNQSCEIRKSLLDQILPSMGIALYEWKAPFLLLNKGENQCAIHIGTGHVFDSKGNYQSKVQDISPNKKRKVRFLPALDDDFFQSLIAAIEVHSHG
ncbi:MAG: DUF4132 domain-containing protein [Cellvibrionaceae bacterium]|nr:DUF4132 domain-containing protein [Cellvibrionaceae bacterium]